jgi:hypothetical protein
MNQTLDLNKMRLAPLTEFEMQEVEGGNIIKAIGNAIASAAEWLWDNITKVAAVGATVVAAITISEKL